LNVNLKVCSHYTHTHTHTLKQKNKQRKGHKEILGWVGYVYYLDSGDDIIICAYAQTHQIVHSKYIPFVAYQLCFNKLFKKGEQKNVIQKIDTWIK